MENPEWTPSLLGEAHVADFLLLIYSRGEVMATDMRRVVKNYYGIVQVAKKLEQAGLIVIEVTQSPRVTHKYRLTARGKKVAARLAEANRTIESGQNEGFSISAKQVRDESQ
jgi:DNA-binding PadR family transcriptional regulator